MKRNCLLFVAAALTLTLFALGSCGTPSGPANPYVGIIPSLQTQWEQELNRLDEKYQSSRNSDYEKYLADREKINNQFVKSASLRGSKVILHKKAPRFSLF